MQSRAIPVLNSAKAEALSTEIGGRRARACFGQN